MGFLSALGEERELPGLRMDTIRGQIGRLSLPPPRDVRAIRACVLLSTVVILLATACAKRQPLPLPYAVGQSADVNGWRITVHGFFVLPGDRWHEPVEGSIFCAVEVTLENCSEQIRFFMTEKQMLLIDADGRALTPSPRAAVVGARSRQWTAPDGEMSIGESAHGAVSYEVPDSIRDLRWVFRGSLFPWSPGATFVLGELPQQ